jgi:hypothetical protein
MLAAGTHSHMVCVTFECDSDCHIGVTGPLHVRRVAAWSKSDNYMVTPP